MIIRICLRFILLLFFFIPMSQAETLSIAYQPDHVQSVLRELSKSEYSEEIHSLARIHERSEKLAEIINNHSAQNRALFRTLYFQQKKAMSHVVQGILSLKLNGPTRLQLLHFLLAEELKSKGALRIYLTGQLKHLLLTQNYDEKEIAIEVFDYLKLFNETETFLKNESIPQRIFSEEQVEAALWDAEDIIEKSLIYELRQKAMIFLREQKKEPVDLAWINQTILRIQSGQSLRSYRSVWWELIHIHAKQNSALLNKSQLQSFSIEANGLFQLLKDESIIHRIAANSFDRYIIFDFLFEFSHRPELHESNLVRNAQLTAFHLLQQVLQYTHRHLNTQTDLLNDMFKYFSANVQFHPDLQEVVLSDLMTKVLKNQNLSFIKSEEQRRYSRLCSQILYWQIDLIIKNISKPGEQRTIDFAFKSVSVLLDRLSQLKYHDQLETEKVGDVFDHLVQNVIHQFAKGSQSYNRIHELLSAPFLSHVRQGNKIWYFKQLIEEQSRSQLNLIESVNENQLRERISPVFTRLRPAVNNKNNCAKVFQL